MQQQGVDVVVELRDPSGKLLDIIDGPTGRSGDEKLEIIAAATGDYALRVRAYDKNEPAGKYTIRVEPIRSLAATRELLGQRPEAGRQAARDGCAPKSAARIVYWAHNAHLAGAGKWADGRRDSAQLRHRHGCHRPHPMHWIGGVWAADSVASAAFRRFNLLRNFDGAARAWRRVTPARGRRRRGASPADATASCPSLPPR